MKTADKKYWDLPGGRIDNVEDKTPLLKVLDREVKEEIGRKVKYLVEKPIFQYRRFHPKSKLPILVTVYEGQYLSGEIELSFEHSSYHWLEPQKHNFDLKDFDNKEEYLAFKDYLKLK